MDGPGRCTRPTEQKVMLAAPRGPMLKAAPKSSWGRLKAT
jgi:hypothetical protein